MGNMEKFNNKSDTELAADARMVMQELSAMLIEFKRRGIEFDTSIYTSGRAEIEIYRTKRTDL